MAADEVLALELRLLEPEFQRDRTAVGRQTSTRGFLFVTVRVRR